MLARLRGRGFTALLGLSGIVVGALGTGVMSPSSTFAQLGCEQQKCMWDVSGWPIYATFTYCEEWSFSTGCDPQNAECTQYECPEV